MTQTEARKLPHGLYRIFWKEGGSSLAAMGSVYNGDRWIAPCNWTSDRIGYAQVATTLSFKKVERMELIIAVSNYGQPDEESL